VAASTSQTDPIREFVRAFNERDLDAFVATLDPEVELHSMKGLLVGVEAARLWATRKRGGVQQTIEIEELHAGEDRAVAMIMRRWHWDDDAGEFAGEDEMAWVFDLDDGRIRSWRPFEDRAEAMRVAGLSSR
jgi:limonene-1,2-epoxide hydrolase